MTLTRALMVRSSVCLSLGAGMFGVGGGAAWGQTDPVIPSGRAVVLAGDISGTGGQVFAFSPIDGSLITRTFLPRNTTYFESPREVLPSGSNTFLVSDQTANNVTEWDSQGNYVRTVISGSALGISNFRGIAIKDGQLFLTVGNTAGDFTGNVWRFDQTPTGSYSNGTIVASGLDSPFDVAVQGESLLVTSFFNTVTKNATNYDVQRVNLPISTVPATVANGGIQNLVYSAGLSSTNQVVPLPDGKFLVAGFNGAATPSLPDNTTVGIYRFNSSGVQEDFLRTEFGIRGVFPLANGNYLYTYATGASILNPNEEFGIRETIVVGGVGVTNSNLTYLNMAFISHVIPEPGMLGLLAPAALLLARRR